MKDHDCDLYSDGPDVQLFGSFGKPYPIRPTPAKEMIESPVPGAPVPYDVDSLRKYSEDIQHATAVAFAQAIRAERRKKLEAVIDELNKRVEALDFDRKHEQKLADTLRLAAKMRRPGWLALSREAQVHERRATRIKHRSVVNRGALKYFQDQLAEWQ